MRGMLALYVALLMVSESHATGGPLKEEFKALFQWENVTIIGAGFGMAGLAHRWDCRSGNRNGGGTCGLRV